jgi:hypothetical protein
MKVRTPMKILLKVLLLIVFLTHGCGINKKTPNQFTSSDDTLIIRTEKQKGDGLFSLGVMPLDFMDTIEEFTHRVIYPKHITNIQRIEMSVDFRATEAHYVEIMTGRINDKEVIIVDENNNKDFTDDSIRIIKPIKWRTNDDLIKCKYLISNGTEIVLDSSWLRIGTWHDDLWGGRSEHLIADFTLNKENYKVGIIDSRLFGFFYGIYPEAAILSHNTETKDTLVQKDILKIGEFLNLAVNYYRFAHITNNGELITLIKEINFNNIIGTQVGMIAPEFTCKTVSGDTIISSKLHDRLMIIANSCGCGGDSLSTQAYYDMRKEYGSNIYILRLDSKIDKGMDGLQIDIAEKFNNDIYNKFRNEYCSRICYLIDKNNRIIDKFPVDDWKFNLPEHINP